jgi:hypothetical protein
MLSGSGCSIMHQKIDPCYWDDVIHYTRDDVAVISPILARELDAHNEKYKKWCQ